MGQRLAIVEEIVQVYRLHLGQTMSIAHLSPYVRKSKIKIENQVRSRLGKRLTEE